MIESMDVDTRQVAIEKRVDASGNTTYRFEVTLNGQFCRWEHAVKAHSVRHPEAMTREYLLEIVGRHLASVLYEQALRDIIPL